MEEEVIYKTAAEAVAASQADGGSQVSVRWSMDNGEELFRSCDARLLHTSDGGVIYRKLSVWSVKLLPRDHYERKVHLEIDRIVRDFHFERGRS